MPYTPKTRFELKDDLPQDHENKIIYGSEFAVEFDAISATFGEVQVNLDQLKNDIENGSGSGNGGESYDDTQIKADLSTETQARINGDTQIKADLATETQARIDGDAALDLRIDAVEDGITDGGGFVDAPNDGKLYGRQSENWEEVPEGGVSDWADIENKPTEFPPEDHTHEIADIDGLQDALDNAGGVGEAPQDGLQYGRQNAGWTEIVVGGADLSNYYTKPQADSKFQVKGTYLTTEADPTVPQYVKDIKQSDIDTWNSGSGGGGGGAVDSVNGKTGAVNLTYSDVGAQVAGSYATSNHNHNGVYQPAGSYATSNHNHSGVYAPVSHTHSEYATTSYAYSKAQSDAKYELKGAGGGNPFPWTGATATFNGTGNGSTVSILNGGSRGPEIELRNTASGTSTKFLRCQGGEFQIVKSNYGGVLFRITEDGTTTAKDFLATSDERLKKDIVKAPLGVIDQIGGAEWKWKDGGKEGSGVIAQQVESVLPHLVTDNDEGMKSVSYSGLIGYLIEEVKDLKLRVAELEGREQ